MAGGLSSRSVSGRALAAACRSRSRSDGRNWNVGSDGMILLVPTVDALLEEVGDAPAVGFDSPLRLDGGVRYHDRSGAADRWFRSWTKGKVAKCVDAFDHGIGRTDDPYRWEFRLDPPIGRKDGFDVGHDERG